MRWSKFVEHLRKNKIASIEWLSGPLRSEVHHRGILRDGDAKYNIKSVRLVPERLANPSMFELQLGGLEKGPPRRCYWQELS